MVSLYDYLKGTQEKEVVLGVFNRNNNNSGPDKNKSGGQSHRCRFQCAKCGKRGHTIERCYHRYSRCDICGRQDHLKYLCKNEEKRKKYYLENNKKKNLRIKIQMTYYYIWIFCSMIIPKLNMNIQYTLDFGAVTTVMMNKILIVFMISVLEKYHDYMKFNTKLSL